MTPQDEAALRHELGLREAAQANARVEQLRKAERETTLNGLKNTTIQPGTGEQAKDAKRSDDRLRELKAL